MEEEKSLRDKVAIVTGASSGIGMKTAEALAIEGAKLALCSRTIEDLWDLSDVLEGDYEAETIVIPTDVRKEKEITKMVNETVNNFSRIDILINNAGIIRYGDIGTFSTKDYRAVMETNIDGMFFATREALPYIERTKGNIVFVGSFDANHPRSFNPVYAASKWWTKGFAHSVEAAVGKKGVAVTLINPSEVRTSIQDENGTPYREKFEPGEVIEPEDVAKAVLLAVSQRGSTTLSEINIYRRDKLSDFF
ncbi:MAG: SDR family oxidoreductase [Thermoplasmata archaeon]